ncbi:methyl-accepting chemotaxis protein [Methylobacillus flagellatus]|uniref:Methyl-accepting chemotaxis sensory transducer n=1 Tax=Methylobacillus flagellatus (strain ATCC 51484 / DSM 6875 / VKM B-1610 / KT) TaxID=265072 RepID=Q1H1X4_METFK|nr:methyl-accepting chemotaxis protein [Methylobacillus flagellatus]ABE49513.1 methyl-accepting chemotaxis sensory transducer [Methylobacillus flagellatus KT]
MAVSFARLNHLFKRKKTKDQATASPQVGKASRVLVGALLLAMVLALLGLLFNQLQVVRNNQFADIATSLKVAAQQVARDAALSAGGETTASERLRITLDQAFASLAALRELQQVALLQSDEVTGSLLRLEQVWSELRSQALASGELAQLAAQSDLAVQATHQAWQAYLDQGKAGWWLALSVIAGLLALALLIRIGYQQVASARSRFEEIERTNLSNQEAILNLLDEMGDLADGDLTVKAEVAENITGAIADSINYTIDSLRDLVAEINRATEQVNQATAQAQETSAELLKAAELQSQQITDTGEAVNHMTQSIMQVSSNAEEASKVARRSLDATSQGTRAVQNTIAGMNEIRTQIQETSKRIKRLGESSQEISEIVDLISDITEQTNILALNAAIQAASAGEAGRGFTVVAEEVQRLAERSSEATKQISAIVKTIQTDTNGAVAAMEKSTEGVVEGARLSDAAGKALGEIENVTNNLARLIEEISSATEAQTKAAATVSMNMQQIQNITSQTSEGTRKTASSIGQLTSLAEELRASVAGFKLN